MPSSKVLLKRDVPRNKNMAIKLVHPPATRILNIGQYNFRFFPDNGDFGDNLNQAGNFIDLDRSNRNFLRFAKLDESIFRCFLKGNALFAKLAIVAVWIRDPNAFDWSVLQTQLKVIKVLRISRCSVLQDIS